MEKAGYPWDECMRDQQNAGYDEETAAEICAAIKNRTVQHAVKFGLAKTEAEARTIVAKKVASDPLFAYVASKLPEAVQYREKMESRGEVSKAIHKLNDRLRTFLRNTK
jgi:uncharacterized protein YpuA (DUF1002 family)